MTVEAQRAERTERYDRKLVDVPVATAGVFVEERYDRASIRGVARRCQHRGAQGLRQPGPPHRGTVHVRQSQRSSFLIRARNAPDFAQNRACIDAECSYPG